MTDSNRYRYVIGAFLDITGPFDNVRWPPLLSRLEALGATLRTQRIVANYLNDRNVELMLEGQKYTRHLQRGCPQGSQLGPTLWKIAMSDIEDITADDRTNVIIYADDIAILAGAAIPHTAISKLEMYMEELLHWADNYGLKFSPEKSQVMTIKGGLKSHYTVGFGTGINASRISATGTVKYLGVILDPRRSY